VLAWQILILGLTEANLIGFRLNMLGIEEELDNLLGIADHTQRLKVGGFSKSVDAFYQILGSLPPIGIRSLSYSLCVRLPEIEL